MHLDTERFLSTYPNLDDAYGDSFLVRLQECDILSSDTVHNFILTLKEKTLRESDGIKIPEKKSLSGYYRVDITKEKKRKTFRGRTRTELIERLYDYLHGYANEQSDFSLNNLFDLWMEYRKNVGTGSSTRLRNRQHYDRYFRDTDFFSRDYRKITTIDLETFCSQIIKSHGGLTYKEFSNVRTVLKGMFQYARKAKLIDQNPFDTVDLNVKFRPVYKAEPAKKVFSTSEQEQLKSWLDAKWTKSLDLRYLAAKFNFYVGLRIGELSALKWEDVKDTDIHICREEIRDRETESYSVEEHTKSYKDRYVALPTPAKSILDLARKHAPEGKTDSYIFVDRSGKRLLSYQLAWVLEEYSASTGAPFKGTHCIRRTYASTLQAAGVPLDAIRDQLGHASLSTTLSYLYNPMTDFETKSLIDQAFSEE